MAARLDHVSLLVRDTSRALAFYQEFLGLTEVSRPDLGFRGAWLGLGEQQIHLLELPSPDPAGGRPEHGGRDRHVAFAVDNLHGIIAGLEAAGIPYTRSRSGRAAIFCRDPDGNALELLEE